MPAWIIRCRLLCLFPVRCRGRINDGCVLKAWRLFQPQDDNGSGWCIPGSSETEKCSSEKASLPKGERSIVLIRSKLRKSRMMSFHLINKGTSAVQKFNQDDSPSMTRLVRKVILADWIFLFDSGRFWGGAKDRDTQAALWHCQWPNPSCSVCCEAFGLRARKLVLNWDLSCAPVWEKPADWRLIKGCHFYSMRLAHRSRRWHRQQIIVPLGRQYY